MVKENILKVGNIQFTETGIVFERPYDTEFPEWKPIRWADIKDRCVEIIQNRIQHCVDALNENVAKATYVDQLQVIWDGGRFSRPVYESMQEFVKDRQLTLAICQQILRELFLNKEQYGDEYNDVFNVISEIALCCRNQVDVDRWVNHQELTGLEC